MKPSTTVLLHDARVLLSLSRAVLDQARVVAGKATVALKLPVSLQIVLRALIGEGLRRQASPGLLADIEKQARTVHHRRRVPGRPPAERDGTPRDGAPPRARYDMPRPTER
jgi:hypothetical protein